MGNTIDKRIVEMIFDNKRFEDGISTTLSSLEKLKTNLQFDKSLTSINSISEAFKRVTLGQIGDDVGQLNSKFSLLGMAAFGVIQNLTNATIEWGKKIIDSVTGLEAARSGLMEYETQINAIQTILANTSMKGTTMDEVMAALGELNTYADKTIYNFTEMTRNIGTFTAAGVELDTSVAAIKGIANLAAVSGSNAQQAATGMYQLSQAISSGTVRLMDWNSVQNAGMGGEIFKEQLMQTARVHGIAVDDIIEKEGSFRDSLAKGWLSSEILLETLAQFTGDLSAAQLESMGYTEEQITQIQKLGEMANDSATKVKTFTQLGDTLKEQAQSGWTETWTLIIGNFEQAKEMFTNMSNSLGGLIQNVSDSRNAILQRWNDLGGRNAVIQTVGEAFNKLLQVIGAISDAFKSIFPPMTGDQLYNITLGLKAFVQNIEVTEEKLGVIKRIFSGVFAVFEIFLIVLKKIGKGLIDIGKYLFRFTTGWGEGLAKLGDWLVKAKDAVKSGKAIEIMFIKIQIGIQKFVAWLREAGIAIGEFAIKIKESYLAFKEKMIPVIDSMKPALTDIQGMFSKVGKSIFDAFGRFKEIDTSGLAAGFNSVSIAFGGFLDKLKEAKDAGKFGEQGEVIKKFFAGMWDSIKQFGTLITDGIAGLFDKMDFQGAADKLGEGLQKTDPKSFEPFLDNIGSFLSTGLLAYLGFKIIDALGDVADIAGSIAEALEGVVDVLEAYQNRLKADTLVRIATAIAILAGSLLVLSLIDPVRLLSATAAISALFANIIASYKILESGMGSGIKGATSMALQLTTLATAILIISGAVFLLSKLSWEEVSGGLAAMMTIFGTVVIASKLLATSSGDFTKAAAGLIQFSIGLIAISSVVILLGYMDVDKVNQGLKAVAGLIAMLSSLALVVNTTNPGKLTAGASAMTTMAGALVILTGVIFALSLLKPEQIGIGLLAISGMIAILVLAVKALPKDAGVSASQLVMLAGAMVILAGAILMISGLEGETLAQSIIAFGVALVFLVGALNAMQGSVGGAAALFIAALALKQLMIPLLVFSQLSIEEIGMALLMLAGVLLIFGVAGYLMAPLVPILLALSGAIFLIGVGALAFSKAIMSVATTLAVLAAVGTAGVAVFLAAITGMLALLPYAAQQIAISIMTFAASIRDGAPLIGQAITAIILAIIESFATTIPAFLVALGTMLDAVFVFLNENIPKFVDAGFQFILALVQGLAENMQEITEAAADVVVGFLTGLGNKAPDLVDAGFQFILDLINAMTDGVQQYLPEIFAAAEEFVMAVIDGIVQGLTGTGLITILEAVGGIALEMLAKFKSIFGIASPSTEMIDMMGYVGDGLVLGVKAITGKVIKTTSNLGNAMHDSLEKAIQLAANAFDNNVEITPTIRPIMDLTDVAAGSEVINSMLSNQSLGITSAQQASSINFGQNGSGLQKDPSETEIDKTPQNITFNQNNYSPAELSRIEIYRQTKNQLAMLKGLVDV